VTALQYEEVVAISSEPYRRVSAGQASVLDPRPPCGACEGRRVELAAQAADMSSRAIGEYGGIGTTAPRSDP
jgi:hypothetical protein